MYPLTEEEVKGTNSKMGRDMFYPAALCGTNSSALPSHSFCGMRFLEKASIPFLVGICIPGLWSHIYFLTPLSQPVWKRFFFACERAELPKKGGNGIDKCTIVF